MKQLTLLFLIKEDKILLAMKKRGFGEGLWNGVGGKLNENESVEEAAVRECQEEIGVTPKRFEKVAMLTFMDMTMGEMLVSVFLCQEWEGEPEESEEMRPQWFEANALPFESMWEDDPHWLPRIIKGEKLTGTFNFDKDNHLINFDMTPVNSF